MVYYLKSFCCRFTIYSMGKEKYENEDLMKYSLPEDVWLHVDDLSLAHMYLCIKPGMTLNELYCLSHQSKQHSGMQEAFRDARNIQCMSCMLAGRISKRLMMWWTVKWGFIDQIVSNKLRLKE